MSLFPLELAEHQAVLGPHVVLQYLVLVFGSSGSGFRNVAFDNKGVVFRVQGSGCRVQGAGCRVQAPGVEGSGCRLQAPGVEG